MIRYPFITFFLLLAPYISFGNISDTSTKKENAVIFFKKKNPKKTYKMVLNESPVFIKLYKGKKIFGIISEYSDSVFTVRKAKTDKETRAKLAKLWQGNYFNHKETKRKADSIYYSDIVKLNVTNVKRIFIPSTLRQKNKWLCMTILVAAIVAVPIAYLVLQSEQKNPIIPIPISIAVVGAIEYLLTTKNIHLTHWGVH